MKKRVRATIVLCADFQRGDRVTIPVLRGGGGSFVNLAVLPYLPQHVQRRHSQTQFTPDGYTEIVHHIVLTVSLFRQFVTWVCIKQNYTLKYLQGFVHQRLIVIILLPGGICFFKLLLFVFKGILINGNLSR